MKPGTQALRDAILMALQDGKPRTTHEVVAAVFADGAAKPYRYYSQVYANLRALERKALVSWIPSNGVTSTLWAARPLPDDADWSDLIGRYMP